MPCPGNTILELLKSSDFCIVVVGVSFVLSELIALSDISESAFRLTHIGTFLKLSP